MHAKLVGAHDFGVSGTAGPVLCQQPCPVAEPSPTCAGPPAAPCPIHHIVDINNAYAHATPCIESSNTAVNSRFHTVRVGRIILILTINAGIDLSVQFRHIRYQIKRVCSIALFVCWLQLLKTAWYIRKQLSARCGLAVGRSLCAETGSMLSCAVAGTPLLRGSDPAVRQWQVRCGAHTFNTFNTRCISEASSDLCKPRLAVLARAWL
jgi:hypothetical protein